MTVAVVGHGVVTCGAMTLRFHWAEMWASRLRFLAPVAAVAQWDRRVACPLVVAGREALLVAVGPFCGRIEHHRR